MTTALSSKKKAIGVPPNGSLQNKNITSNDKMFAQISLTACKPSPPNLKTVVEAKGLESKLFKLFQLVTPQPVSGKIFYNAAKANLPKGVDDSYLKEYIDTKDNSILINAILAGTPTDTFSNEFQQHPMAAVLNGLIDSTGASTIRSLRNAGMDKQYILNSFNTLKKLVGNNLTEETKENLNRIEKTLAPFKNGAKGAANLALDIFEIAGSNFEFPKIWRSSSFNSSSSINVKLYCPFPKSDEMYFRNIIAPLAILLTFAAPQGGISNSAGIAGTAVKQNMNQVIFSAPFYCIMKCPGLMYNPFGMIPSCNIVKGGEKGAISLINRPVVVDVNISFGWLHNVVVSTNSTHRQTVKEYLKILSQSKDVEETGNAPVKLSNTHETNTVKPAASGQLKRTWFADVSGNINASQKANFALQSSISARQQVSYNVASNNDSKIIASKSAINNNTYKPELSSQTQAASEDRISANQEIDLNTVDLDAQLDNLDSEVTINGFNTTYGTQHNPSIKTTRT